ncbi:MAG: alpha-E domain-containing protein [Bacteroidota bacterium]
MLSRIANHLFWMARYMERSEHLARYLKVQYYSSLDAPEKFGKEVSLYSILFMLGGQKQYLEKYESLQEDLILKFCCFDEDNIYSIKNCISASRENARSVRNVISLEVWEAINRMFHETNRFSGLDYSQEQSRYDFFQHVIENAYIVKGMFNNTLLRDSVWSIVCIGTHLERAIQTTQILIAKLHDIHEIEDNIPPKGKVVLQNYQWTTSLRCVGGFDMSRHYYKKMPNKRNVAEFLILHPEFPKSVAFNLVELYTNLDHINLSKDIKPSSSLFAAGKLAHRLKYTLVDGILDDLYSFLIELRDELYTLGTSFEREYLSSYEMQSQEQE